MRYLPKYIPLHPVSLSDVLFNDHVRISRHFSTPDYNQCLVENGGCEQKCVNQVPGYECQCDSGYSLNSDNMSCVANAECSVEGDNFVCQCLDGFSDEASGSRSNSSQNINCIV